MNKTIFLIQNKAFKTIQNKINLNNVIIESDNNLIQLSNPKISYNLNLSNLEISENGFKNNNTSNNISNKLPNTNNIKLNNIVKKKKKMEKIKKVL